MDASPDDGPLRSDDRLRSALTIASAPLLPSGMRRAISRPHMTSTPLRAPHAMRRTCATLLALLAFASCSKLPGDLKVTDITTGRELGADGNIRDDAHTMNFWSTDTFYVAVQTEGSADNVTLQARWTGPDGTVVGEASKTISPKGSTTTLLQAAPPKDKEARWPAGNYKLEILVNGTSQGTRDLNAR
jgi:hypothetical protein